MVIRWLLALSALLSSVPAIAAPPDCSARLLSGDTEARAGQAITARALVRLRDFGRVENGITGEAPFSVSPDGRWAALILRQADPDTDGYCVGVVLVPLRDGHQPRLLDVGGDFITSVNDIWGIPDLPNGSAEPVTPVWSPDGRWLAYRRRDKGVTQVWRVGLDGHPAEQVSHLASDALDVAWSPDGLILLTTRPGLAAGAALIDREGRSGFLYDARFWPLSENRPLPPLPVPTETRAVDPVTKAERPAVAAESGVLAGASEGAPGTILFARSSERLRAWTARDHAAMPFTPARLHVEKDGKEVFCPAETCSERVAALWWRSPGELLFLRSGSPANGGRLGLYRWRIGGERSPVRVLETADALLGCDLVDRSLVCARETATTPRSLVRLDPDTGQIVTLFDPNPAFRTMRLGPVERLVWSDGQGVATYGDLVLPPDHKAGQRHPLIVVQYQSRGFLRGGTGDEYPIQLLAEHGFAVLSFQRPAQLAAIAGARDLAGVQRVNIDGWAERRMIVSALEAGVDTVIARGVVDPDRIGITGLSDGAVTAQFALNHSGRFKAAILSSCCDEPSGGFVVGPAYRDAVLGSGYPPPGAGGSAFWSPLSLAANAARLRVPLLIEAADSEYRLALETWSALQVQGAPVEMRVFPDEYHVKWHPAHRLAIYKRNLAWFDFWLNGKHAPEPGLEADLQRWDILRTKAAPAG
jgi:dipeptidyl aminopeptidase/acylaminoacyl peptidase